MTPRIRILEDDEDAGSEQDNTNLLNSRSNSEQYQQQQKQMIVSIIRGCFTEELQGLFQEFLKQNFGPMVSTIVKENIEKHFAFFRQYETFFRQNFASGSSSAEPRSLQLQFLNKPSLPIYSGFSIKAEGQTPLEVAIVDCSTQEIVKSGPESSLKVEIIAVHGDFDGNGSCSWSLEGLSSYIVKQKDGTKSLLKGKVHLTLNEGIGSVGDILFRYDHIWMRKCDLKLVAITMDKLHGITVRGAMTEPFEVKDKRNTYNRKCGPPRLGDPVGRLQKIGKALSGCLIQEKIVTVKDFLSQLSLNPQRLREILVTMSRENWEATVNHARTCELDSRMSLYTHISPDQKKTGVVFNVVAEVLGLYSESGFKLSDNLSEKEKAEAQKMVVAAYEHMEELKYFDEITSMHAYWESVNSTSASGSPITPCPLVPYIEASTPSGSGHNCSFPVFSPPHDDFWVNELLGFGDVDVYQNSGFPVRTPSLELWVNELSGYQNSEEDMQRLLACAAAQKRWMVLKKLVFGALKWFSRRKTAGVSNVVSSEGMQVPKRLRIY